MKLVRTVEDVRANVGAARETGRTVGFVPTMGYLHDGHLSLIDRCRDLTDFTVLSIYVNPLQFAPTEDFDRYPRDLSRDLSLAEEHGVDLVFAPDDDVMYPSEPAITVMPRRLADRLCGASRPGHFEGVLTVVTKLFGIVGPDISVFGQKDYQQSALIRRLVAELKMPIRIEVAPTVREDDGLAMSSRNEYLSEDERSKALGIVRSLAAAVAAYRNGERSGERLRAGIVEILELAGLRVEYVELVTPDDLETVTEVDEATVVAVAAHVGEVRLIDNVRLGAPDPGLEARVQLSDSE